MTILEIEAIEHLDFDFEESCEHESGCSHTAEYIATMTCCMHDILLCGEHEESVQRYYRTVYQQHQTVKHMVCGRSFYTIEELESIRRVERL